MKRTRRVKKNMDPDLLNLDPNVFDINLNKKQSIKDTGLCLVVYFPIKNGTRQEFKFPYDVHPKKLVEDVAVLFYWYGVAVNSNTRKRRFYFVLEFLCFLKEYSVKLDLHIDTFLSVNKLILHKYMLWLNGKQRVLNNGTIVNSSQKANATRFFTVCGLVKAGIEHKLEIVDENIEFPKVIWKDSYIKINKTKVISSSDVGNIESACLREISSSWKNYLHGKKLTIDGLSSIKPGDELNIELPTKHELSESDDFYSAILYLKELKLTNSAWPSSFSKLCSLADLRFITLDCKYGKLIEKVLLRKDTVYDYLLEENSLVINPVRLNIIQRAIVFIKRNHSGIIPKAKDRSDNFKEFIIRVSWVFNVQQNVLKCVRECLYASTDILVPYVVYFCTRGYWNADSILTIKRDSIIDHPLCGDSRILMSMSKPRSSSLQIRSFSKLDEMPIHVLYNQVIELTDCFRECASAIHKDLLFIFQTRLGEITSYVKADRMASASAAWQDSLSRFIKRNDLLKFNLSNLRKTGGEVTHKLTNGDYKAVQTVLNHKSISTTIASYKTPDMAALDKFKIATNQNDFEKWIFNDGNENTHDCKDRFNSPYKAKGEECMQCIGCYDCPNSTKVLNEMDLAKILKLQNQLIQISNKINPERFEVFYKNQLSFININVLPKFPTEMFKLAELLMLELPEIPTFE